MIRVALVEDQALVRQGLRALLSTVEGLQVVLEAADGEAALEVLPTTPFDVLLLDMRMPRCGGLELLRRLKARGPLPPTLVLTTFDDEEDLLEALATGAKGYLLKDVPLEQLVEALRTLAAGGSLVQPVAAERIAQRLAPPAFAPPEPLGALTPKELQVLRLMSGGFNNHEIARALGLAHGTVKNHVSTILSKLGVRDRTRAVLKALEQGLI